ASVAARLLVNVLPVIVPPEPAFTAPARPVETLPVNSELLIVRLPIVWLMAPPSALAPLAAELLRNTLLDTVTLVTPVWASKAPRAPALPSACAKGWSLSKALNDPVSVAAWSSIPPPLVAELPLNRLLVTVAVPPERNRPPPLPPAVLPRKTVLTIVFVVPSPPDWTPPPSVTATLFRNSLLVTVSVPMLFSSPKPPPVEPE